MKALEDGYKAQASDPVIIQKSGEIHSFINIVEAEGQHTQALLPLFKKYRFRIPENTWTNRIKAPEPLLETCQIGLMLR